MRRTKAEISGVAIKLAGKVWALPMPNRHHNVISFMRQMGENPGPGIQGFVDDDGRFYTRCEAFDQCAFTGRELKRKPGEYNGPELFSEDLW